MPHRLGNRYFLTPDELNQLSPLNATAIVNEAARQPHRGELVVLLVKPDRPPRDVTRYIREQSAFR